MARKGSIARCNHRRNVCLPSGFAPGAALNVYLDGGSTAVATSAADSGGNIPSGVTFTMPTNATLGSHNVAVTDAKGNTVTVTYTVAAPSFTLNPTTVPKHTGGGQSSQSMNLVGAKGFAPSSTPITIADTSTPTPSPIPSVSGGPTTTAADGTIATTSFTLLYGNGNYTGTIQVTDHNGNVATSTYTA